MKTTFLFIFLCIITGSSFGQKSNDVISLRVGPSSTNIVFKEAFVPAFRFFGFIFKSGKTFVGDGPEFGISKGINKEIYLDLAFSTFSGGDVQTRVNNTENSYTLKGFKVPLTANHLLRDDKKKLRINLGAGVQYLQGHLKQFETITNGNVQTTNQITDINISELQLAFRSGIQFRVIHDLFVSFFLQVSISTNGRYSDSPALFLKYTFRNKIKKATRTQE